MPTTILLPRDFPFLDIKMHFKDAVCLTCFRHLFRLKRITSKNYLICSMTIKTVCMYKFQPWEPETEVSVFINIYYLAKFVP